MQEALERARDRLDRLDFYPRPVRIGRVRVVVAPWFFRIPGLRRYHGYALCHIWQMQNEPVKVLWAWLTHRYRNNPYEQEARRAVELTRATT